MNAVFRPEPMRWHCGTHWRGMRVLRRTTPGSPGTTSGGLGMRSSGPSTRMTTPAGPGAQARTLSTPITRVGGGRTDPRWDAAEQALRQDGYPSWREAAAPPWHDAEPTAADSGSGWRGGGRPARQESPPAPYRGSHARSATGQPGGGRRRQAALLIPDHPEGIGEFGGQRRGCNPTGRARRARSTQAARPRPATQ
jgi:hypothetical protein